MLPPGAYGFPGNRHHQYRFRWLGSNVQGASLLAIRSFKRRGRHRYRVQARSYTMTRSGPSSNESPNAQC